MLLKRILLSGWLCCFALASGCSPTPATEQKRDFAAERAEAITGIENSKNLSEAQKRQLIEQVNQRFRFEEENAKKPASNP